MEAVRGGTGHLRWRQGEGAVGLVGRCSIKRVFASQKDLGKGNIM